MHIYSYVTNYPSAYHVYMFSNLLFSQFRY